MSHVLGEETATETTVQLFNSVRPIKKDNKGKYIELAVRPQGTGVLVTKKYINN